MKKSRSQCSPSISHHSKQNKVINETQRQYFIFAHIGGLRKGRFGGRPWGINGICQDWRSCWPFCLECHDTNSFSSSFLNVVLDCSPPPFFLKASFALGGCKEFWESWQELKRRAERVRGLKRMWVCFPLTRSSTETELPWVVSSEGWMGQDSLPDERGKKADKN